MDYGRSDAGNANAITITSGVIVPHVDVDGGCTLLATTYYIPLGSSAAVLPAQTALISAHLKWAAAVAGTITIEVSNLPAQRGNINGGPVDVLDYSVTAGDWYTYNPTATASTIVLVAGASNTASALTVTAGGAAAGGCFYNLVDIGARRARIKLVLTAGGVVRCNVHGKAGS